MLSQDLVSECLVRLRNDRATAYTFFLWAGKEPGYAYSVRDYHSMVAILGKFKRFDTAWSLVEEMRANSLVMPHTIMIMIRRYCAAHDVAKVINAFHTMKKFVFSHGIEEFHDFLNALCRYKNVQDAEHLLLSNEASFPFETKSFNIVLNGWSHILINLRESKRFWRNMDSRGIRKDLISYSSMISCFSTAGYLKDVLKLFDQMKENGIEPDREVYNSVIHALAKGRCMDKARELVEKMEESGIKPDTVTYNSLIRELCKTKKPDDAKGVLNEMSKRRISPSRMTFHALFHVARSSDEVFELLDQMQNVGFVPSMDTYIMLIRKFCGWKQFDSVFKLWHDVIPDNGLIPDRSAYLVLVHGLYLNGRLEEAAKFYEEMINKGFNPEPNTEKLIQAWVSGREAATRPIPLLGTKDLLL